MTNQRPIICKSELGLLKNATKWKYIAQSLETIKVRKKYIATYRHSVLDEIVETLKTLVEVQKRWTKVTTERNMIRNALHNPKSKNKVLYSDNDLVKARENCEICVQEKEIIFAKLERLYFNDHNLLNNPPVEECARLEKIKNINKQLAALQMKKEECEELMKTVSAKLPEYQNIIDKTSKLLCQFKNNEKQKEAKI